MLRRNRSSDSLWDLRQRSHQMWRTLMQHGASSNEFLISYRLYWRNPDQQMKVIGKVDHEEERSKRRPSERGQARTPGTPIRMLRARLMRASARAVVGSIPRRVPRKT